MNRDQHFREMLARRTELSSAEEAQLQHHLQECPACAETASAYLRQGIALRSLQPAQPPPDLRAWVLTRVQEPAPVRRFILPRPALLFSTVAAALLIVVALTYVAGQRHVRRIAAPAHRTILVRPVPTPLPTVVPPPPAPPRTGHPHHAVRPSVPIQPRARHGSIRAATPRTFPAAPAAGSTGGYAPAAQPTAQVILPPAVVSQQLTLPTPTPQLQTSSLPPRALSRSAPIHTPRRTAAPPAATPTPAAVNSRPPVHVGSGVNPGSTPTPSPPRPPLVSVDKAPPEAIVFAPVPSPPPAPPTVPTPPSTPAPPPTSATPPTPGPVYQTGATPGPNPVLVPVTPTTPIP